MPLKRSNLRYVSAASIFSFFILPTLLIFFQNCSGNSGSSTAGDSPKVVDDGEAANEMIQESIKLDERLIGLFASDGKGLSISRSGTMSFFGKSICGATFTDSISKEEQFKTFPCFCQWTGNIKEIVPGSEFEQALSIEVSSDLNTSYSESHKMAGVAADVQVVSKYCLASDSNRFSLNFSIDERGCLKVGAPLDGTYCVLEASVPQPVSYRRIDNECYKLIDGVYFPEANVNLCPVEESPPKHVCSGPHTDGSQWVSCGADFNCSGFTLYDQLGRIVRCE